MNTESLTVIECFAQAIGILPTLHKNSRRVFDWIKGIIFITLFIILTIFEFYEKFFVFNDSVHPTIIWTNSLSDWTITGINILGILLINLLNGNKIKKFVETLRKLEIFIVDRRNITKERNKLVGKFLLFNLAAFSFILIGIGVITSTLGFDMYKYFILKDLQYYNCMLTAYLMTEYVAMIGKRMKDLNNHLKMSMNKNKDELFTMETNQLAMSRSKIDINTISKAFTTISELINTYNEIFGYLYIIYSCNIVTNILSPLNMALLHARGITLHEEMSFGPEIVVFFLVWLLFPIVS